MGVLRLPADHALGTPQWAEEVFASLPTRNAGGRSRYTHRYGDSVDSTGVLQIIEGPTELGGKLALEYLQNIGLVRRFKSQPFMLRLDDGADPKYPDFLAEFVLPDGVLLCVAETKAARYLTRSIERHHEDIADFLARANLRYVLWTDKSPLTRVLRANLLRLRTASTEKISAEEITRLLQCLDQSTSLTVRQIVDLGCRIDAMHALAWRGKVFYPLMEPFNERTCVTRHRSEDLGRLLLGSRPDPASFWNSLSDC
jgi:hypothetical protein